ncbi:MAG: hypothetical protein C0596_06010 [Marinilabiliales bacterium]|nr:MAG: hypothetical protein C0596_06010 [Marinilabiliales bacterium]
MKTLAIALLVALIALPTITNSPIKDKSEKKVTLSQVSSLLSPYQENEEYDFINDKVDYKYIEEVKYDEVFEESAVIYATIKQVRETVDAINEGEIAEDNEYAILCIGFAVKDLPKMDDRIQELTEQTKNMTPKKDFTGEKIMKAGKATKGLNQSKDYLKESSALLPILMTDLAVVSKKVLKEE